MILLSDSVRNFQLILGKEGKLALLDPSGSGANHHTRDLQAVTIISFNTKYQNFLGA